MTAQILVLFEIFCDDVFCDFFKKIFRKLIFFLKFEIPISIMGTSRVLSGSQGLRNLPPTMTAPILVVFEI